MARPYHELVPHAFRWFSAKTALLRTGLPTARYYLTKPALPPSDKPALFTMNILPPMMTVWHHLARKNLGDRVDIVICDCSGRLKQKDFPGAMIQRFLNPRHAQKCDQFLWNIARNRKIGWVSDDDVFIVHPGALDIVQRELAVPNTACLSFVPRPWWHFEIEGKSYEPAGTYSIAFNRDIYMKEHCTFAPAEGNTHPDHIGKPVRRYDSFDKSNEGLLRKGYRCAIVPPEERNTYVQGFTGMSGGVMLLYWFRRPEEVLDFFLSPPKEQWQGNMLFGILAAMLAITTIQELHTKLTGAPYPLPSLPSRADLEKIRRDHTPLLRADHTFRWVDEAAERLRREL